MSRMIEYMRWKRSKKKKRLREYAAVPRHIDVRKDAKRWWKGFQRMQDELQDLFPGLVKKDSKEVLKDEQVRSDKGSQEEHRYDYY